MKFIRRLTSNRDFRQLKAVYLIPITLLIQQNHDTNRFKMVFFYKKKKYAIDENDKASSSFKTWLDN